MDNPFKDYALSLWKSGRKTRTSPRGWVSGNGPCCSHNGESLDKRGRGGFIFLDDGTSNYHCFNCGFKASHKLGTKINKNMRQLLIWLGASAQDLQKLNLVLLKFIGNQSSTYVKPAEIKFEAVTLPEGSKLLKDWVVELYNNGIDDQNLNEVTDYIYSRGFDPFDNEFYWCNDGKSRLDRRVIIPFYHAGVLVGYTGRLVDGGPLKYYSKQHSDYVFNLDKQVYTNKFVIVCEGVIDALSLNGVALLRNECSAAQVEQINRLNKRVILVPDNDKAGDKLIDVALENGWGVSFPDWEADIKDINDAICRYGRLFTLKSILDKTEDNVLKIKLLRKKYV